MAVFGPIMVVVCKIMETLKATTGIHFMILFKFLTPFHR